MIFIWFFVFDTYIIIYSSSKAYRRTSVFISYHIKGSFNGFSPLTTLCVFSIKE